MTNAVYAPQRTTQGNAIFGSQGTAVTPPFAFGGGGGGASRRQVFPQEIRRRRREEDEKAFDEDKALAKTEREMMAALGFPLPEEKKEAVAKVLAKVDPTFTREEVDRMVAERVDREVKAVIEALLENLQ